MTNTRIRTRQFYDKIIIVLIILWVMLFVLFSTFCLTVRSQKNPICQRALNTYSLVPSNLVIIKYVPRTDLNVNVVVVQQNVHGDTLLVDKLGSIRSNNESDLGIEIIETNNVSKAINNGVMGGNYDVANYGIMQTVDVNNDNTDAILSEHELKHGVSESNINNAEHAVDSSSNYRNEHYVKVKPSDIRKRLAPIDQYGYYRLDKIKTKYDNKFVIHNPKFCSYPSTNVLIIVPSSARNLAARNAIRSTYGRLSRDRKDVIGGLKTTLTVRVLFVFGKVAGYEKRMREEYRLYKDTLVLDFVDSYSNLTRKMINAFRWVNMFCSHVSYVIKADDDVFINVPLMLQEVMKSDKGPHGDLFGYVYHGKRPVARKGKWTVKPVAFPFSNYPEFISGTSYTISGNLIGPIVYYAQLFPYLNIEDAFITGVICKTVLGATLHHLRLSSQYKDASPNACDFVRSGRFIQTQMKPASMDSIWNVMQDYNKYCPNY
ncbi:hypothetical protein ACF0H5_023712 [Mactra antiquata]